MVDSIISVKDTKEGRVYVWDFAFDLIVSGAEFTLIRAENKITIVWRDRNELDTDR